MIGLYCTLRVYRWNTFFPLFNISELAMSFSTMGLSESILQSIRYPKPTPIQQQAIPEVIKGKDVMAAA